MLLECFTATLQTHTQWCQATARYVLYWWGAFSAVAAGVAPWCRDAVSWEGHTPSAENFSITRQTTILSV